MNTTVVAMHTGPHLEPGLFAGPPAFVHFLGGLMGLLLFLLVVGTLFALWRFGVLGPGRPPLLRGSGGQPPWLRHQTPEFEARKVLAERFARGEISTDEFMERASVLNWTPGVEPPEGPTAPRRRP